MSINMEPVNESGVLLEMKDTSLKISGNITSPNPNDFIDPFLSNMHKQIIDRGVKEITMDVTQLSFLNSAGIRCLVDWILLLEELPEDQQYTVNIIYSSKHLWQESSMSTLVYLNPSLVRKEKI